MRWGGRGGGCGRGQVVNEADTLSINHNWINAANVSWTWELLQEQVRGGRVGVKHKV